MTAVAGCDVSAGVVSKTSGPQGVEHPDGPGDHYASHRLLSTVAPWRQSRSRGSPCGVGCQSPSLAFLSLPDLPSSLLWYNFLGSLVLKHWSLTVSLSLRGEGGEGVKLWIRCGPVFSFLGLILILMSGRYLPRPGWISRQHCSSIRIGTKNCLSSGKSRREWGEEGHRCHRPVEHLSAGGIFPKELTAGHFRLGTGLLSGTLRMRRGISTTQTQEPYRELTPKSKLWFDCSIQGYPPGTSLML